tara:strand:+ start:6331 stop:6729 length:399 start_codon:yes stop_codon:yes gene_type:complete
MLSFLKAQQKRFQSARKRFISRTKKAKSVMEKTAKKNPVTKHAVTLRNHKVASVVKNLANRHVVRKKLRSVTKKLKPKKVKKIIKEKSVLVGGQRGGKLCGQQEAGTTEYTLVGGGSCGTHTDSGKILTSYP